MPFGSEKEFEQHIRRLIVTHILPLDKQLMLLHNKKAVDVLLCREGKKPDLFFIEIKYHKTYRLGTGHGKGGGFQPEIIKRQPAYFEKNMRWILGDMRHEGYWFVTNKIIRRYLAGAQISEKYNNIQNKLFSEEPQLTEQQFISALTKWLCPA